MYNGITWNGLKDADFTELDARISPTNYRSPRAVEKPKAAPVITVEDGAERSTGKVKYVSEKGYGFIKSRGIDEEIFFHLSKMDEKSELPMSGDFVTFDLEENGDKPRAINVLVTSQ
ncbi:cold shock domain-containing protein [Paenibacillus sp. 453mf]|uniref:cold shock domain-containing protein n=1 Tax=Paenibacillus sp. 453mf TaxID=1761874 RepID=UPI0008DF6CB5|nr:cold shock domain-containing protein [Paenibacillus sp. 453mf]SFS76253.1 Cold shock protein, CspA family [Paenibacillus sp. 453mf]